VLFAVIASVALTQFVQNFRNSCQLAAFGATHATLVHLLLPLHRTNRQNFIFSGIAHVRFANGLGDDQSPARRAKGECP
jgi:hypothetical protein